MCVYILYTTKSDTNLSAEIIYAFQIDKGVGGFPLWKARNV